MLLNIRCPPARYRPWRGMASRPCRHWHNNKQSWAEIARPSLRVAVPTTMPARSLLRIGFATLHVVHALMAIQLRKIRQFVPTSSRTLGTRVGMMLPAGVSPQVWRPRPLPDSAGVSPRSPPTGVCPLVWWQLLVTPSTVLSSQPILLHVESIVVPHPSEGSMLNESMNSP